MSVSAIPLLPQTHQVSLFLEGPLPPEVAQIGLPRELLRAVPRRQTQFRAGRYCAMKALESLDSRLAGLQVDRAANGTPVWPSGTTGSITHTDDFVSAAVALTADAAALGIDTERIMSESHARDVGPLVAAPEEVNEARAAGMSELEAFTLVFSAKESIFKCLHPMIGQHIDFRDVLIVGVDPGAHTFAARVMRTLAERFPIQTTLHGRFEIEPPWMHTGMALSPGRDESHYHRNRPDTRGHRVLA